MADYPDPQHPGHESEKSLPPRTIAIGSETDPNAPSPLTRPRTVDALMNERRLYEFQDLAGCRFVLIRHTDISGVSGAGVIATGICFPDGAVVLRWITGTPTTVLFRDMDDVETIHGHNGASEVVWIEENTEQVPKFYYKQPKEK